jgi:hypothetical protein
MTETPSWQLAVGRIAREKALSETGVALLKAYAAHDAAAMVEGQKLYGDAKAAFDELIATVMTGLAEHADAVPAAGLDPMLRAAVEKRKTFCARVDTALPKVEGAREGLALKDLLGIGETIKSLIDGAVTLWKEWKAGKAARRKAIEIQLQAQRWRSFADVPAAQ